MPWISNHKHNKNWRKINKKFLVLKKSCQPRTGGPVEISNTGNRPLWNVTWQLWQNLAIQAILDDHKLMMIPTMVIVITTIKIFNNYAYEGGFLGSPGNFFRFFGVSGWGGWSSSSSSLRKQKVFMVTSFFRDRKIWYYSHVSHLTNYDLNGYLHLVLNICVSKSGQNWFR